jgi:two-component system sensor histidine kinase KdpD
VGLHRNLLLAEDLGARIEPAAGRTTAEALAAVAKRENASIVVIGHRATSRWRQLTRPSLVDQLLRDLQNVDVYVVERGN